MVVSAKRPLHAFHRWVLLLHWHGPKAVRGVTVASLARLAHGTRGARDARNALLAHRPGRTHLAIPWRTLRARGARETIFSCDANTNVPLFTFGTGQSSHSRQALPSFSANLTREPGRSWSTWPAGSTVLPWGAWSSRSCRHLHGELNPGGVVSHPFIKHFNDLLSDESLDFIVIHHVSHGARHPRQSRAPHRPWRSGVASLSCGTRWPNRAHGATLARPTRHASSSLFSGLALLS